MAEKLGGVETEEIVCGGEMPAFLARPSAAGRYPGVILMHERYGLVRHTRDLAVRCAKDGFTVLAPNFFYEHPDQNALNAGASRCQLTDPQAVAYLDVARAALSQHPAADVAMLAIAGYCQTGRHPVIYAAERPVQAIIVWYGAASKREWPANEHQPRPLEEAIKSLSCPVFGCFGAADHIISIADVRRFRDALELHNKSYEIHVLAGAPHGWLNDTMPGRYRKPQAEAGWAAQQRFLHRTLKRGIDPAAVSWRFSCDFASDYDFSKNVRLE
jgi:carboxymethylenebutenolidase